MERLSALSGDARLLDALARGSVRGRAHSVFRRAVNVVTANGTLYALATADADNAPETLVVDAGDFLAVGIASGDRVTSHRGALEIDGRCRIALAQARRWQPSLPSYPADDSRLRANVGCVRDEVRAHRQRFAAGVAARASALLDAHAHRLRDALAARDGGEARAHATAMLGLGPGLTPSGDDFLVGLLAVLNLRRGPVGRIPAIADAIADEAAVRTNAISIAALRAAARGEVRERVAGLLRAMLHSDRATTVRDLDAVLAIGATSGAALASGIVCGFEAHIAARTAARRGRSRCARDEAGGRETRKHGGCRWKARSTFHAA